MSRIILPSCSDFVFKLIFGDRRNADSLAAFLRSVLDLPAEEYGSLAIVGPHLKREGFDDKPGVLDVKMNTKSGEVTDAEIQVENVPQM
ncbi:MAG: Rpn family recombination-promoting nuclease/putative transposase, partial [Planctomycetaceae bacterium]|nr:Rpn family recombination-promoting nuclease/putative transposase [Planctomycetaceae bacterium]